MDIFILIILIIAGLNVELKAQEALKAMMKKCETIDNVDMSVVRQKNKETLKVTHAIITVRIKSNKALVDEFIAAFMKDEPNAYETIYSKKGGKDIPQFFRFKNVSFSFKNGSSNLNNIFSGAKEKDEKKDEGNATITMIEN